MSARDSRARNPPNYLRDYITSGKAKSQRSSPRLAAISSRINSKPAVQTSSSRPSSTSPMPNSPAATNSDEACENSGSDPKGVQVRELQRQLEDALKEIQVQRNARHQVERILSEVNESRQTTLPLASIIQPNPVQNAAQHLNTLPLPSTSQPNSVHTEDQHPPLSSQINSDGHQNGTQSTTVSATPSLQSIQYGAPIHMQSHSALEVNAMYRRKTHDLPVFSGLPEQWPMFIADFRQSTQALGYTPLENNFRLHKCLVGEAREAVDMLLLDPENIEEVLETLEFQFGRPELLAATQIAKIKSLPPFSDRQIDQLVPFARKVRNLVAFLQRGECAYELASPCLLKELTMKMPMSKRLEWSKDAMNLPNRATIVDFAQWLKNVSRYVSMSTDADPVAPTSSVQPPRNQGPSSSNIQTSRSNVSATQRRPFPARNVMMHVSENKFNYSPPAICKICLMYHDITICYVFLNWTPSKRWAEVKKLRLCFSCLQSGHDSSSCQTKRRCVINNCQRHHHPLLHEDDDDAARRPANEQRRPNPFARRENSSNVQPYSSQQPSSNHPNTGQISSNQLPARESLYSQSSRSNNSRPSGDQSNDAHQSNVPLHHCQVKSHPLLFRIIPVKLFGPKMTINTYAMLDEGSAISMIDEDLANILELSGPATQLNLQWFGDHTKSVPSRCVDLGLSGNLNTHKRFELKAIRTVPNISLPTQSVQIDEIDSRFRHIKKLPISQYVNAKAKILIGLDFCHLAAPKKMIQVGESGPIAVNTSLGWILYGRQSPVQPQLREPVFHVREPDDVQEQLDSIIKDYFTTENFGVKQPTKNLESAEDARARNLLEMTTFRINNHFQTGLLWRSNNIKLPNSYPMALKRLTTVENKMRRDINYANLYNDNINDYVKKGYARQLSSSEARETNDRTWYLPHFGVVNSHKPNKIRMVFDAAASIDGISLNSVLISGPDLNPPLTGILFKFRIGLVGICGDIREMFHQVQIRSEDRCAQRFLWRHGDSSRPPDVYEMVAMTFGATCSPAAAHFVKNKNADDNALEFPSAVYPIKSLHYVDDYVASYATPAEAARVTAEVIEVHRRGGFELRNFVSSSPTVLQKIGAPPAESALNMQPEKKLAADRILGMCWDTKTDSFLFIPNFAKADPQIFNGQRRPTKREVLSIAMSVFDPFGLLADVLLEAKLIVQELFRVGVGWDEPLPDELQNRWTHWTNGLDAIKSCRIPRCFSPNLQISPNVQLHVFADASEVAFAAVAYWRIQHKNGFDVRFIVGKTKCAPLKLLSIPRLELQAAVLATRLLHSIRQFIDVVVSRAVLWTDSKCVVQWIRSDHRKFKPFVAHRVAEILDETTTTNWRWLPTSFNAADDATRTKGKPPFNNESRWLNGPEFLKCRENEWPADLTLEDQANNIPMEEIRSKFVGIIKIIEPIVDLSRFSKYNRLCRTVAWSLRFIHNISTSRLKSNKRNGELTITEINHSEQLLCRIVQQEYYEAEYKALVQNKAIESGSSVKCLMPYLEDNVMRIYGRTDAADNKYLSVSAKRPILLPPKHIFTNLLINHFHAQMHHQNDAAVICAVRNKFWVPNLRNSVRTSRRTCVKCHLRTIKPVPPVMGQLPADRLTPYIRPFTYTGLDFFGPVNISVGRRREKRWVALFTCLTIRAVHLEIAENLSTDACLVSIKNFCNLRGIPLRIRSDNGTNFVGASKVIRNASDFLDQNQMRRELGTAGIEWVFNSPSHPEAGGCWERLVQSVKRVLVVILHDSAPRIETLRCVLLEAANIVNSRPLTHVPVTPDEEEPLTPNHFLIGGINSTTKTTPNFDANLVDTRKQWRVAQHMASCFWAQWVRSYLPELTKRTKWHTEQPSLQLDHLVLICDSNVPRNMWRRGRVVRIFPGPDGRIRNAEVQVSDGILKRPVSKLAILNVKCEPQMDSVHGGRNVDDQNSS